MCMLEIRQIMDEKTNWTDKEIFYLFILLQSLKLVRFRPFAGGGSRLLPLVNILQSELLGQFRPTV